MYIIKEGQMNDKSNLKWLVTGSTQLPKRNHGFDAGWDLYLPNMTEAYAQKLYDKNPGSPVKWSLSGPGPKQNEAPGTGYYIQVNPHQDVLIPLQVHARFDPEWAMVALNKSGVATIQKLVIGADLIDSSYQGEIHCHVINTSNNPQFISFGQKLVQVIMVRHDHNEGEIFLLDGLTCDNTSLQNISLETFYDGHETSRGVHGFGAGTGGGANKNIEDKPPTS